MVTQNFDDDGSEVGTRIVQAQPHYFAQQISNAFSSPQDEILAGLMQKAQIGGTKRALKYVRSGEIDNPPDDGELQDEAREFAFECIQAHISKDGKPLKDAMGDAATLTKAYLDAYDTEINRNEESGHIPDKRTKDIQQTVRVDKEKRTLRGEELRSAQMRIMATLRGAKALGIDMDGTPEDFDRLESYLDVYCPYYLRYQKGVNRQKMPEDFRGRT